MSYEPTKHEPSVLAANLFDMRNVGVATLTTAEWIGWGSVDI